MSGAALRTSAWRGLQVIPVVIIATLVVFLLLQLVPGDPAITLAGENATPEQIEQIRALYNLDQPLLVQYGQWLLNAMQGDLARSLMSGEDVTRLILQNLPPTLLIVTCAMAISLAIGIPLGVMSAIHRGGVLDTIATALASVGIALPNFWLGMILINFLALQNNIFPATGAGSLLQDPLNALWYAFLPALSLAAGGVAEIVRQLRSALLEVLDSQHVRTLHAKGLSPARIVWQHAMKNVSTTLLTVTGLLFNRLLGATVVIEAIFAIPGIGSLIVRSAIAKDFPIVQGVVFTMVLLVILGNLIIDVLYPIFDPRVER
ncbi:Dipeptide transport system permease protein DppB [Ensifer psoraleae]|uniref:ABC transporter permease n=1 Tax=Sinorhizobium psoraleae TaxID=520838 RepID=UPI00156933D3|nr:ABC transporter permease [Sinorhizobium psoraleae]NRP72162.1 Dipeptide transport system permease protein DppB [Sinorhizobium psoraleae]